MDLKTGPALWQTACNPWLSRASGLLLIGWGAWMVDSAFLK
jgi:ABC-type nickel/cobalt efflux system permease component RcnA